MSDAPEDTIAAVLAEYGIAPTKKREERAYPLSKAVPSGYCFHRQHIVDDNKRVVTCGQCGAPLDPIAVLSSYAHDPAWVIECRKEVRQLEAEISALRKEVSALKAAKRRAKEGARLGVAASPRPGKGT